jgi:predicted ester cyclase
MSHENTAASGGLADSDRAAIETLYRAFSEHDPDLLDEALAEAWQDIPLAPGQAAGREGMKPLIRAFSAAFPGARVTVHEVISAPGRAGVRGEITGTHKGEWFGIAPTGARFTLPIHDFHHVREGLITHTWHMEDWFGWLHQVGAMGAREQAQ